MPSSAIGVIGYPFPVVLFSPPILDCYGTFRLPCHQTTVKRNIPNFSLSRLTLPHLG